MFMQATPTGFILINSPAKQRSKPISTSSTIDIVKAATDVLHEIYVPGYHYKKAGVIVMGIEPTSPQQLDLFDYNAEDYERKKRLDKAIDQINKVNGTETVVLGSQQYTKPKGEGKADVFANAMKRDHKSKNPTTRWSDIIKLKTRWDARTLGRWFIWKNEKRYGI